MPPMFARADVTVSGTPITGVNVTLQSGVSVTGTVVYETETSTIAPTTTRVSLDVVLNRGEVAIGVNPAVAGADRTFSLDGVPPGRYRLSPLGINAPSTSWTLKSATIGGEDALDGAFTVGTSDMSGLTITYTDRVTELTGTLEDATGRAAPDYFVIVFPADSKYWTVNSRRIKAVRPGLDGRFSIRGLPPGEYRIGAVVDVENGDWFEPTFLQPLLGASAAVTLGEGEKKVFPLKIGG